MPGRPDATEAPPPGTLPPISTSETDDGSGLTALRDGEGPGPDAPATRRERRRRAESPWWGRALLLVVALGALAQVLVVSTSTIGNFNDSSDYRQSSGTPVARIDLSDTEHHGRVQSPAPMIDVLGNGLRAGFAVQAVYAVLPNDRTRIVVQGILAAVAWAILALTLARIVRPRWAQLLVAAATMLAALSPVMTWWHVSIAQESLMLSATLVFLAATVSVLFPEVPLAGIALSARARMITLVGAFAFAAVSRPPSAALLGPIAIAVLLVVFLRRDLRRSTAVIAAVVTVVVMGWSALALADNASRWNEQQAVERFAARMTDRDYLSLARDLGMPRCPQLDQVVELTRQGRYADYTTPVIEATTHCPALRRWFEDGGLEPQQVARHDPALFARQYWDALDALGAHPGLTAKALHGTLAFVAGDKIVKGEIPDLPDPLASVQRVLWAPAGLEPVLAVLLAAAALVTGFVRKGRRFALELALLTWSVLCSAVYYALVWSQAGMEPTRHALPLQLVLTVVIWVVALRALSPVDSVRSAPRAAAAPLPPADRAVDERRPAPSA
jgi:hypothetical protein